MSSLGLELTLAGQARLIRALKHLDRKGWSLAFAESCTAGLAAVMVAGIKDLGHILHCGYVVYSDDAKSRCLGVDPALVASAGAVSGPVTRSMAERALALSGADIAVGVTGFAGPAGPEDEEGLVHVALAMTGRDTLHHEAHFGPLGQQGVQLSALNLIIQMLDDLYLLD